VISADLLDCFSLSLCPSCIFVVFLSFYLLLKVYFIIFPFCRRVCRILHRRVWGGGYGLVGEEVNVSLTIEGSKKERREYSVVRSRLLLGPGQSGIRVLVLYFSTCSSSSSFSFWFLLLFDGILLSFFSFHCCWKSFFAALFPILEDVFSSLSLSGQRDGQVAVCNVDSSPYSFWVSRSISLNRSQHL
jgi:hypothetical protein